MACEFYHQVDDKIDIIDELNNYFLPLAEKINTNNIYIDSNADEPLSNYNRIEDNNNNNNNNNDTYNSNPIHHLSQAFNKLFTNIH